MLSRIERLRLARHSDEYSSEATSLTSEAAVDDVFVQATEEMQTQAPLPPRYRFRDLLLGDFAFRDDGQR